MSYPYESSDYGCGGLHVTDYHNLSRQYIFAPLNYHSCDYCGSCVALNDGDDDDDDEDDGGGDDGGGDGYCDKDIPRVGSLSISNTCECCTCP